MKQYEYGNNSYTTRKAFMFLTFIECLDRQNLIADKRDNCIQNARGCMYRVGKTVLAVLITKHLFKDYKHYLLSLLTKSRL